MTLNQLAEKLITQQTCTADSERDYRGYYDRAIRRILGDTDVTTLDDPCVLAWLKTIIVDQPASQVKPIVSLMRKLLDLAVKRRHLSKHALQDRPLPEILGELGFTRPTRSWTRTYFKAAAQAPGGGTIPFSDSATEWMRHSTPDKLLRDERINTMTTIWIPAFTTRPIELIDRLDLLKVTIPLQQAGRVKEAYRAVSILRLFFRDAIVAGRLTANPARVPTICLNIVPASPGMKARHTTNAKLRLFASFK